MLSTIEYRGPDGGGEYFDDNVQLGAVRLAIIDPKEGAQPNFGCRDQIVSVYNGEAYNHHSIQRSLSESGHRLANASDSEVLPHLYESNNDSFVSELRGMFSFALWDASERKLLLGRDRMGIKPLFYAKTRDYLVFGSEIKAIIASGLVDAAIDTESLDDLFSLSYPCPPRTMFKNVFEVRPAHIARILAGSADMHERRYWQSPIPHLNEHRRISAADAKDELRSLLRDRIYDHTISDVPVAAYLSGGLDSSAICSLMHEVSGDAPETFSIAFESRDHDESEFFKEVAEYIGSQNHVLSVTDRVAQSLKAMVWHTELPLQFPLALPLIGLSNLVKSRGFSVALSGEGADELMGGYDCFRADKMRRLLDRPILRRAKPYVYRQLYKWNGLPEGTVDLMLENERSSRSIRSAFGGVVPPWYDMWTTVGVDRERLLGVDGRRVRPVSEAPAALGDLLPHDIDRLHPLDAGIALEQATRLPAWILLVADRSSMAAGVESRVPFLDHEVVEFVASLPPDLKIKGFREKAVLRDAVEDLLPSRISRRQKRPFYTPIREWFFSDSAPEFVSEFLSDEKIRDAGLFDPKTVAAYRREIRLVSDSHLLKNRLEWTLLLVLSTQILHHQFCQRRCESPPASPYQV